MKKEDLFYALGDVGEDLLQMAEEKKFGTPWKRWVPLAACLVLVITFGALSLPQSEKSEAQMADMYTADMEYAVEESAVENYAEAEEAPAESRGITDKANGIYTAQAVQDAWDRGDDAWIMDTFVTPNEEIEGAYLKRVSVEDDTVWLWVGLPDTDAEKQYEIRFEEDGWEYVEISTPG